MKTTLNDVLLAYAQSKKNYLKESTHARYMNLIQNHIKEDIGKTPYSSLSNRIIQDYCDRQINKGLSIIIIKEVILLIKLAIKREAKINGKKPIYIDLDLPLIKTKKKIEVISRMDQKIILNCIVNGNKKNIKVFYYLY